MARRRYSEADLLAMIPLYFDGELDRTERDAVEAYLSDHPEAAARVAESARLIDLLDEAVDTQPLEQDFTTQVMARVRALTPGQKLRRRWPLVPAATLLRWGFETALLVVLVGLLVTHPWAPRLARTECQLLGDDTWRLDAPAAVRVVVRSRATGLPMPNVPVRVRLAWQHHRETLLDARTNDQGSLDTGMRLPAHLRPGTYLLSAHAETPDGLLTASHVVRLVERRQVRVELFSPGVAAGDDLLAAVATERPAAGETAAWQLDDACGRRLAGGAAILSDYGTALLRVPTSSELPPGPATLWAKVGGTAALARLELRPPAARELDLACRAPAYVAGGGVVAGVLTVARLPGDPVAGAWTRAELQVGRATVRSGGRSDEAGRWAFRLTAPRGEAGRVAWLRLTATGADGARGTTDLPLPAAPEPLLLTADPGGAELVAGVQAPLRLSAQRPDGSPVQTLLRVRLNRDPRTDRLVRTGAGGSAQFDLVPAAGSNAVTLIGRDGERRVEATTTLHAAAADRGLMVWAAREKLNEGEPLTLAFSAGGRVRTVYVDLLAGGQRLATRSLALARGQGRLVLHPPAGVTGPVTVRAYAPGPKGIWRSGAAWVTIVPRPALAIAITPTAGQARLRLATRGGDDQALPAEVQLAAVSAADTTVRSAAAPPAAGPAEAVVTLSASSFLAGYHRARFVQRWFFRCAPIFGAAIGALVLICVALWVFQTYADPFEAVSADERRVWGRLPRVHRRGPWIGLGAALGGVAVAGMVLSGAILAGRQALELAGAAAAPRPWQPPGSPADAALRSVAAFAAVNRPAAPLRPPFQPHALARVETGNDGRAEWAAPADVGPALLVARAAGRDGGSALCTTPMARPQQVAMHLTAPPQMTVGDEVAVPVEVVNPTPRRLAVVLNAAVEHGLELAAAPTQRVVVPALGRLALGVAVRAAEPGPGKLSVRLDGPDVAVKAGADVDLVPAAPRLASLRSGVIDGDAAMTVSVPAGGVAPSLALEVMADPVQVCDDALRSVARGPCYDAGDVLSAAMAEALRARLPRSGDPDQPATLHARAVRAWQRLMTYEVQHPPGRPTGAFARRPGGDASRLVTARVEGYLRAVKDDDVAGPEALPRVSGWLRRHPPATPVPHKALTDRGAAPPERVVLAALKADGATGATPDDLKPELESLNARAQVENNPYWLALLCAAAGRPDAKALERLAGLRSVRGDQAHWYPGPEVTTATGGSGRGAAVEATALAVAALSRSSEREPREAVAEGSRFLLAQMQPDGTWGSAPATVAAARALLATLAAPAAPARGVVVAESDGKEQASLSLADETPSRSAAWALAPGPHRVTLRFRGRGRPWYRLTVAYSRSRRPADADSLACTVGVDRVVVPSGGSLMARVEVANRGVTAVNGVSVRMPVPPGFAALPGVATDGLVTIPLGPLAAGETRGAEVALRAVAASARVTPAEVEVRATYDPALQTHAPMPRLRVL